MRLELRLQSLQNFLWKLKGTTFLGVKKENVLRFADDENSKQILT